MVELRRHRRAPLEVDVAFSVKGSTERVDGRCRDISLGGMFIETPVPLPFGTELVVYIALPGYKAPFVLPSVVRWARPPRGAPQGAHHGPDQGMGIQFGLLGARETHAITEFTRSAGSGGPPTGALSS